MIAFENMWRTSKRQSLDCKRGGMAAESPGQPKLNQEKFGVLIVPNNEWWCLRYLHNVQILPDIGEAPSDYDVERAT